MDSAKIYETQIADFLAALGLTDKVDALSPFFRKTVIIGEGDGPGASGVTRIGGGPDLPKTMAWPRNESGFHFNFLAQINLSEMPFRDPRLPADGLLSIFNDSDQDGGPVIYTPADMQLIRHELPDTAEADSESGFDMVTWSSEAQRLVLDRDAAQPDANGVSARIDDDGRLVFSRDGAPLIVLADQYNVTPVSRCGVFYAGFTIDMDRLDQLAEAAGLPDEMPVFDACYAHVETLQQRHRMLGFAFTQGGGDWTPTGRAIKRAKEMGWSDLLNPDDWFVLCELVSGGAVDHSFGDFGSYIVVANRADTERGDFTRCVGFVEAS